MCIVVFSLACCKVYFSFSFFFFSKVSMLAGLVPWDVNSNPCRARTHLPMCVTPAHIVGAQCDSGGEELLHSASSPAVNLMLHKPMSMGKLQGLHFPLIWGWCCEEGAALSWPSLLPHSKLRMCLCAVKETNGRSFVGQMSTVWDSSKVCSAVLLVHCKGLKLLGSQLYCFLILHSFALPALPHSCRKSACWGL